MQQHFDVRNNLLKEKFSNAILTNEEKLRKEIELKIRSLSEKPNLLEKAINGSQELNKLNDLINYTNYDFNGIYHVFDQHTSAVTRIRFANNQIALFACSSSDSNLSVCQLLPLPATVIYTLVGHTGSVSDFDWSNENDLIVSCSFDCTVRLWCTKTGHCLRVIKTDSPITVCLFQSQNNNTVLLGNTKGYLHALNVSTGMLINAGSVRVNTTAIQCMCLDNDGKIVWVGDSKGFISSYSFDLTTGCLTRLTKCICAKDASITSISTKNYVYNNEAKGKFILVNTGLNQLMIFRIDAEMKLRLKYSLVIKHQDKSNLIRSVFCPLASKSDNARLVSGSEDGQVFFYSNLDFFSQTEDKPMDSAKLIKLQGHSGPVLDVCFSYDESFLASSDTTGCVIIWKKECSSS